MRPGLVLSDERVIIRVGDLDEVRGRYYSDYNFLHSRLGPWPHLGIMDIFNHCSCGCPVFICSHDYCYFFYEGHLNTSLCKNWNCVCHIYPCVGHITSREWYHWKRNDDLRKSMHLAVKVRDEAIKQ